MTKRALERRVEELEGKVAMLELMVEEARVLADAERAAADEMEARMSAYLGGQLWAQAAQA